jgi:hypothetical protein
MRQALVDRISQTQRHQAELVKKVNALTLSIPSPTTSTLHLWTLSSESTLGSFDWDPKPNREMFESLSLPVSSEDEALALEKRIQQIREELLTPYPPIPDPSAPRLLSLETSQTGPVGVTASQVVPTRSIKRKSIRFSMARKGRPSLFRIDEMQDVVNQVSGFLGVFSFSFIYGIHFSSLMQRKTIQIPKATPSLVLRLPRSKPRSIGFGHQERPSLL